MKGGREEAKVRGCGQGRDRVWVKLTVKGWNSRTYFENEGKNGGDKVEARMEGQRRGPKADPMQAGLVATDGTIDR